VITASGLPSEHGETAIIMAQMGETADIAAEVSRIFTGVQIQCAQCHDHFSDRWKRNPHDRKHGLLRPPDQNRRRRRSSAGVALGSV
jgi:hypothetical protein